MTQANKVERTFVAIFAPVLLVLMVTSEALLITLGFILAAALTAALTTVLVVGTLLAVIGVSTMAVIYPPIWLYNWVVKGERPFC